MPSLINMEQVKQAAAVQIAEEEFKKAVAQAVADMKLRKQHILPWQICFQWPVKLKPWKAR